MSTFIQSPFSGNVTLAGNQTFTGAITMQPGPLFISDGSTKEYQFRTTGTNLDFEGAGKDIFLSNWQNFGFTGTQFTYARWESGVQLAHLVGKHIFVTAPFAAAIITVDPTTGTLGQVTTGQVVNSGGNAISQGSGAPTTPNGVNPTAGDIYFRTDTPAVANQRMYICTTGGGSPVWSGIV